MSYSYFIFNLHILRRIMFYVIIHKAINYILFLAKQPSGLWMHDVLFNSKQGGILLCKYRIKLIPEGLNKCTAESLLCHSAGKLLKSCSRSLSPSFFLSLHAQVYSIPSAAIISITKALVRESFGEAVVIKQFAFSSCKA